VRLLSSGKVRDSYEMEDYPDLLLLVASDRISAYDAVMHEGVPSKGRVLTALSTYWFDVVRDLTLTHEVVDQVNLDLPTPFLGRSTLVRRATMIPVECVVRGYLAGSGWREYLQSQTVGGQPLPAGLELGSELPQVLFTPSTKALVGHDEPLTLAECADLVGDEMTKLLSERSIALYLLAARVARERGLIIADTKFEFGIIDGDVVLCDEVLTPDSSRYWDLASYSVGREPTQLDKQLLRDWLDAQAWDRSGSPPHLPEDLTRRLTESYRSIYERITGLDFRDWPGEQRTYLGHRQGA
jgi:phosphoribosylaminoimidazole-succinocarboxamide synthase